MSGRAWTTLASRRVVSSDWLTVELERVQLPDGRVIEDYARIRTRDYVAIVACTDTGDVVVERAYRHGPRSVNVALPAGGIDDGEDPLAAAQRELLEETGHGADRWTALGAYGVDANYGVATGHLFLAEGARAVAEPASGDLEEMEIALVPLADLIADPNAAGVVSLAAVAALGLAARVLAAR